MKVTRVLIVVLCLLSTFSLASGATITVNPSGGADYTTLTAAITAAVDGDKIFFTSASYNFSNESNGTARFIVSEELSIDFGNANLDVNGPIPDFEIRSNNVNFSNFILRGHGEMAFYVDGAGSDWVNCNTQYENITIENGTIDSVNIQISGVTHGIIRNITFQNLGQAIKTFNSCDIQATGNRFINTTKYDINDYTVHLGNFTTNTYNLGRVHSATGLDMTKFSGAPGGAPELAGSIGAFWNISATLSGSVATVTVGYSQSAVDSNSINESTLKLYHLNSSNAWEALPTEVDTVANLVHGNTTAFSAFGIAGDSTSSGGSASSSSVSSSASSHAPPSAPAPEVADLSKIYQFFKTNTIVVYGSEVDRPVAEVLARHFSPDSPLAVQTADKGAMPNRNYILVGGPVANRGVEELNGRLSLSFRRPVQGDKWSFSDGLENQAVGAIQILDNPNDPQYKVLVVAGLTRTGTQRATDLLTIPGQRMNGRYVMAN